MTPDEARDLLDGAAGAAFVIHLDSDEAGPLLVEVGGAPLTVPELTLAAHAPEMAAMIAGMRAEYAVQNRVGDKWLYEDADGRNLAPYETERISWWPDPIPQSDIADRGEGMARIVRRYVTTPEEV